MTDGPARPPFPSLARQLKLAALLAGFLLTHPRSLRDLPRWIRDCFTVPLAHREPWWPYPMTRLVAARVTEGSAVFEFGCGGSTLWLEDQGARVTAVEHDEAWHRLLLDRAASTTTLIRIPAATSGELGSLEVPGLFFDDYVASVDAVPDQSLDLVIVDGRARVACALRAAPKVRPGGYLLLDDAQRPAYADVGRALADWPAISVLGLKPGGLFAVRSTLWRRPG